MRFGRRCLAAAAAGASAPARRTTFGAPLLSLVPLAPFLTPLATERAPSLLLLPVRSVSLCPTRRPRPGLSLPPLVSYCSCSRSPRSLSLPRVLSPALRRTVAVEAPRRLYVAANSATHATPLRGPSRRLLSPTPTPRRILPATATATTTIRR